MKTGRKPHIIRYFSFGQDHSSPFATKRGIITLDKDIIVKISAPNPREVMFSLFDDRWAEEYEELPDMEYYKGIFDINKGRRVLK